MKRKQCHKIAILVLLFSLLSGCALWSGWTTPDLEKYKAVMEATGTEGCIYIRANAKPPASDVSIIMLGTWGSGQSASKVDLPMCKAAVTQTLP